VLLHSIIEHDVLFCLPSFVHVSTYDVLFVIHANTSMFQADSVLESSRGAFGLLLPCI
jgi:hypothetical protein